MTGSNPDKQFRLTTPAVDFREPMGPHENERTRFEAWWKEASKEFNMRATPVWDELAWSGWFARSEIAEGKLPTVFKRKGGE